MAGIRGLTKENFVQSTIDVLKAEAKYDNKSDVGVMIHPTEDEWAAWRRYFKWLGLSTPYFSKLEEMYGGDVHSKDGKVKRKARDGDQRYMVPARWPWDHDENYQDPRTSSSYGDLLG